MTHRLRVLAWLVAAVAAAVVLGSASALLALASLGVFGTSRNAWTVELPVVGVRVNVVGLVRLATLPGVAHLLDGRSAPSAIGTLHFTREGTALRVACAPCRVQHPELAPAPVQIRALAIRVRRGDDAIEGAAIVDRVEVQFAGRLHATSIELNWQLPPTEVASLYRALGAAVPETAFARIEGTVRAQGTLALPSGRGGIHWSADGLAVDGLGTERLRYGGFRFACRQDDGTAHLAITGEGEKSWAAADSMGPYLAAAVIAAEDQRFHRHAGYDPLAMAEVLADLEDGRPKRGASTITQQLARTLFTGGDRTVTRKLREMLYAIEMERTLGKARILELYLNTVDWGPGVCGARAAARAYFNKPPARLTAIEAAWLAGILRNPHAAWERQFARRQPDRTRATEVVTQMRDWSRRERQRFAAQPLEFAPASRAALAEPRRPPAAAHSARRPAFQAAD
jgi:Transglycosylase